MSVVSLVSAADTAAHIGAISHATKVRRGALFIAFGNGHYAAKRTHGPPIVFRANEYAGDALLFTVCIGLEISKPYVEGALRPRGKWDLSYR